MKALIAILAVALVGVAAEAKKKPKQNVGPDSSWEEIFQAGLNANFPHETMGGYSVSVYGACVDGDRLVGEVTDCTKWREAGETMVCESWGAVMVSKPLTETVTYCQEYAPESARCLREGSYTRSVPLSHNVAVEDTSNPEHIRHLFNKRFDIPACN